MRERKHEREVRELKGKDELDKLKKQEIKTTDRNRKTSTEGTSEIRKNRVKRKNQGE